VLLDSLKVDKSTNTISWYLDKKPIKIVCENLDSAKLFSKFKIVIALVGSGNYPSNLIGFSVEGNTKFEIKAPEGFVFSYLTEHPTAGIAVVCGGNEKTDGWYDWYYAVDPKTGKLTKHCPAY